MRDTLRKIAIAATAAVALSGATLGLTGSANAQHWHGGHGGWHGGGWHGGGWHGGGWGWRGFGLGLGTGLLLGGAPYYYGGGPYGYGYRPYPYYGYYSPYGYDGGCVIRRRWVIDYRGRRVLRRVRICY